MKSNPGDEEAFGDPALAVLDRSMPHLSADEREALRHLKVVHRFVGRSNLLQREGEVVTHLRVLCKGWAMRCRWLDEERRQVLDFVLPGDLIGLHVDGAGASISDVVTVTACEVGEIDAEQMERASASNTGLAIGLNQFMSRQLTLANDQVLRLGRMTAYERVCSFLLEIFARQQQDGSAPRVVDFPVTQTVVADLLGLSVVHLNRQVMRLRREGLLSLSRRQLIIHDEARLAQVARYRDRQFCDAFAATYAAE